MKIIGINGFKRSGKDTSAGFIKEIVESACEKDDDGNVNPLSRVEHRAFADNLKIMAALALGWDERYAVPPDNEKYDLDGFLVRSMDYIKEEGAVESYLEAEAGYEVNSISGREYLQKFGAHARDVFGDSFWVDQVLPPSRDTKAVEDIWGRLGRKGEYPPSFDGDTPILPAFGVVTDVRYPNEAERAKEYGWDAAYGGVVLEVVRPGLESDGHSSERPLPRQLVDYQIVNDGDLTDLRNKVSEFLAEAV